MTNDGGLLPKANIWYPVVAANGARNEVEIGNTAVNCGQKSEYCETSTVSGPPLWVWPFAGNPNDLLGDASNKVATQKDGALLIFKPGDVRVFTGAQTVTAIWVKSNRDGATYSATES